jgi:hypothetical protein
MTMATGIGGDLSVMLRLEVADRIAFAQVAARIANELVCDLLRPAPSGVAPDAARITIRDWM